MKLASTVTNTMALSRIGFGMLFNVSKADLRYQKFRKIVSKGVAMVVIRMVSSSVMITQQSILLSHTLLYKHHNTPVDNICFIPQYITKY